MYLIIWYEDGRYHLDRHRKFKYALKEYEYLKDFQKEHLSSISELTLMEYKTISS